MSCASKIGHSMTAGTMPVGLIACQAKRVIGDGPYQPVKDAPRPTGQDIAGHILVDSEHKDPGHVWGDEGPVND